MILCKLLVNSKDIKIFKNIKYTYIEIVVLSIFLIIYFVSRCIPDIFKYGVYYTPIFILIITVFYYQKGILSKFMGYSFMLSLANISFEFYMIHQVVIGRVNSYLGSKPILAVVVAFLISIIISVIINELPKRFYSYKKSKSIV